MVTRDGLSCPVGHYAINPVPRTAIFREAALARREAGMPEIPLRIEISILPGGSWRRKRLTRIWGSSVVSRCLEQLGL